MSETGIRPAIERTPVETHVTSVTQQFTERFQDKLRLIRWQLNQAKAVLRSTGHLDTIEWLAETYLFISHADQGVAELERGSCLE